MQSVSGHGLIKFTLTAELGVVQVMDINNIEVLPSEMCLIQLGRQSNCAIIDQSPPNYQCPVNVNCNKVIAEQSSSIIENVEFSGCGEIDFLLLAIRKP